MPGFKMAAVNRAPRSLFRSIKFFVLCHSALQLAQLLVSGCMKSSISTIERRYGLSSQRAGLLASFNEVGNTLLIVFVSFWGSRVHRPRFIAAGASLAATAALLMTAPHFLYGPYEYTDHSTAQGNSSSLCRVNGSHWSDPGCGQREGGGHQGAYPLLLLGQLLLGIGAVPIQPFGISYIDDYASKRNSPIYLGILLAVTSIGPAFGFMMSSFTHRIFVDFNTVSKDQVLPEPGDLRWVGAWWLGFLLSSCLLFLTALPILFFPRELSPEVEDEETVKPPQDSSAQTMGDFIRSFPRTALRTLRSPVYMFVVLAQVNLSALLSGLATFMPKFMERQFSQTTAFSNMMIGGVALPFSIVGIILGGVLMRRCGLSVVGAGRMCLGSLSLCILSVVPLLLIGCSTQNVHGVYPREAISPNLVPGPVLGPSCRSCWCPEDSFNPVCGSGGVEFRSPCHAGCTSQETDPTGRPTNYTNCGCVSGSSGLGSGPGPGLDPGPGPGQSWARPGTCGSPCSDLVLVFVFFMSLTCFIASFCHTPSYIIILRSVPVEDKSFAVGLQYMFFRVLAFFPGPVLYGRVIDTTCLLWGQKCNKNTSCLYYDMDRFRHRFLGLQMLFFCGGWFCFLVMVLIQRRNKRREAKPRYELAPSGPTEPGPGIRPGPDQDQIKT